MELSWLSRCSNDVCLTLWHTNCILSHLSFLQVQDVTASIDEINAYRILIRKFCGNRLPADDFKIGVLG
jgi:hypothetical protein